jgi:hypothetical protein
MEVPGSSRSSELWTPVLRQENNKIGKSQKLRPKPIAK